MEIKKSPKADLQNKRGLLLEIGLVVALALVIAAFAYTPKEHRIEKVDLNYGPVEEEITEITRQDQKPPEPPKKVEVKVIADLLQVVTNGTQCRKAMRLGRDPSALATRPSFNMRSMSAVVKTLS